MEFDLGRLLTEESKRMMNCLHEGIFIADKMGNIVFANQALLEMAGGTEEYALSLNVFNLKSRESMSIKTSYWRREPLRQSGGSHASAR